MDGILVRRCGSWILKASYLFGGLPTHPFDMEACWTSSSFNNIQSWTYYSQLPKWHRKMTDCSGLHAEARDLEGYLEQR
jgi:hypothetical protein